MYAYIYIHTHTALHTYTYLDTHHEQRVLSEAEAGHDTTAMIHSNLDEPLPLLEIQNILVVESSLQNFLNPANDKSDRVPLLQFACDAFLVAANCCMRGVVSCGCLTYVQTDANACVYMSVYMYACA